MKELNFLEIDPDLVLFECIRYGFSEDVLERVHRFEECLDGVCDTLETPIQPSKREER